MALEVTTIESSESISQVDGTPGVTHAKKNDAAAPGAERQVWSNKAEFLLMCISLSVGLGNVWRFPYVAYANGGGAFLIPYIIVLTLVGKPMYYMELAFGQYHSEGPVKVWKRSVPLARGIGIAQTVITTIVAVFYIIIMSWTMFYFWTTLIAALKGEDVPWGASFCSSDAAHKPSCFVRQPDTEGDPEVAPILFFTNATHTRDFRVVSSAQQYFDRVVLAKYKEGTMERYGLGNMGGINLGMMGCLAASWLLVFVSLIKGVKSSGKASYVTSTLPFIVLFILLGRGASLDGAVEGIKYFIIPQFGKLLDIATWRAAIEQMFFSLAVGFGSLTMVGSYNRFNNNCYQDSWVVSVADSVVSLTSGFAMFSILGYLAQNLDVGVERVVDSGPGMAFVTFPEAVTQMPVPHLWGILFFIMLYTLGLGSEIALMESALTFLCDRYPSLRARRALLVAVACSVCFLFGLPFIMQGGEDVFNIFNVYANGTSGLFVAFFEMFFLMWVYGLKRFINNLREMLGETGKTGYYLRTSWLVVAPTILLFILILTLITHPSLHDPEADHVLPPWADGLGWAVIGVAVIQIPLWAAVIVYKAKGDTLKEKLVQSLWPDFLMSASTSREVELRKLPAEETAGKHQEKKSYVNSAYSKDN